MFTSRTKLDLMIEVWEKLDCESVGAAEIEAIETVVQDKLGKSAVKSPMIIARELADEGAVLRHDEILKLDVKRRTDSPYDSMFRNILKLSDFKKTLQTIRNLESFRRKFVSENNKEGIRTHKKYGLKAKEIAIEISADERKDIAKRQMNHEIAEWFSIYLQSPEVFEHWVKLRQSSEDFQDKFGNFNDQ